MREAQTAILSIDNISVVLHYEPCECFSVYPVCLPMQATLWHLVLDLEITYRDKHKFKYKTQMPSKRKFYLSSPLVFNYFKFSMRIKPYFQTSKIFFVFFPKCKYTPHLRYSMWTLLDKGSLRIHFGHFHSDFLYNLRDTCIRNYFGSLYKFRCFGMD